MITREQVLEMQQRACDWCERADIVTATPHFNFYHYLTKHRHLRSKLLRLAEYALSSCDLAEKNLFVALIATLPTDDLLEMLK